MSRRAVPSRVSPHPVSSGISFQALPPATIAEVEKLCDYHVEQCTGRYAGPVSRHLFDLSNEVKSLLAPLQAEDAKKQSRLAYLEALLLQWEEVFGRGGMGEPAQSPGDMARLLAEQQRTIAELTQRLNEAQQAARASEEHCKAMLTQHLRAHRAELLRVEARHAAELERIRLSMHQ